MDKMALFAAMFVTLYVGHHVGDYWVQTDAQAWHKGDAGADGVLACLLHVLSYVMTQWIFVGIMCLALFHAPPHGLGLLGMVVSGVTHYFIDRREHGVMFWLARRIPGKANFLKLGVPRPFVIYAKSVDFDDARGPVSLDNPSLGTGAWALDQSAHLVFSVFVPALIMAVVR